MIRWVCLCGALLISGCAHVLWTSATPFPFHRVYLSLDPMDPLYAPLKEDLIMQAQADVVPDASSADLILVVQKETRDVVPTLINFYGFATQNTLLYSVSLVALDSHRHYLLPYPISIRLSQTQDYSDNHLLSHQDEENFLWEQLYRTASDRCLTILRFMPHDATH